MKIKGYGITELRPNYFHSEQCTVCTAKGHGGNPLRELADLRKDENIASTKISKELKEYGITVSQQVLDKHFRNHSPYIRLKKRHLLNASLNTSIARAQLDTRDAEEEVQKLIDIGGTRIDQGEIPVDKELYMFALDRKLKNQTPISVQNLVMNFGEALVEKKVIEGETSD